MSKEVEPVAWPCHLDLKRKRFAEGINSEVFLAGDKVIKVYKKVSGEGYYFLTEDKLKLYRNITNDASRAAESEDWTIDLQGIFGKLSVRINPFSELRECPNCGKWEGRVPYVKGPRLLSFPYSELTNWMSHFGNLNYRIEQQFDVQGIFISPVNVKWANKGLIITDLCDDIAYLEKKYS